MAALPSSRLLSVLIPGQRKDHSRFILKLLIHACFLVPLWKFLKLTESNRNLPASDEQERANETRCPTIVIWALFLE